MLTLLVNYQSWIKQRLAHYRMYQNDKDTFRLYSDFAIVVREIVGEGRNSAPRPQSMEKFEQRLDHTSLANEDTFLDNIIPILIPEEREMLPQHLTAASSDTSPNTVQPLPVEEFWKSGVFRARNINFRPGLVPNDPNLAARMRKHKDKEEGQTNPRPDYVFGLRTNHFNIPDGVTLSGKTEQLQLVVPLLYDPMFIIEGKSDKGQMGEAVKQACRSGAAVIKAARSMRERIGQQDVEGPDKRTFLFSGTLSSSVMHLWVHWAEVKYIDIEEVGTVEKPGGEEKEKGKGNAVDQVDKQGTEGEGKFRKRKLVNYHMNMLETESVPGPYFLERMRPMCLNILDWGSLDRVNLNLEQYYQDIYTCEKKQGVSATETGAIQSDSATDMSSETTSSSPNPKRQRS